MGVLLALACEEALKTGARIMVRSSANCEDLQAISGAGLYDSIANVKSDDADAVSQAINRVWQSLWTKRAALSRRAAGMKHPETAMGVLVQVMVAGDLSRAAGMKHTEAAMGVLVQEMVAGDLSFIAFSSNPVNRDKNQVYIEMCVGMGETLASAAQPGTPYRLTWDKTAAACSVSALASFSNALVPAKSDKPGAELEAVAIDHSSVSIHSHLHKSND
ncbi:pyruvate phosphate dikinase [Baffinella frigidus]|nr:pyruvate phosphate dikinase [Cryptophyta sp. CCMP2293]